MTETEDEKRDRLLPFKTTILWGEAPEPEDAAKTYRFATQAELDAFLHGVSEAEGWMGWREVKEGYVVGPDGWEDGADEFGEDEDEDEEIVE